MVQFITGALWRPTRHRDERPPVAASRSARSPVHCNGLSVKEARICAGAALMEKEDPVTYRHKSL